MFVYWVGEVSENSRENLPSSFSALGDNEPNEYMSGQATATGEVLEGYRNTSDML